MGKTTRACLPYVPKTIRRALKGSTDWQCTASRATKEVSRRKSWNVLPDCRTASWRIDQRTNTEAMHLEVHERKGLSKRKRCELRGGIGDNRSAQLLAEAVVSTLNPRPSQVLMNQKTILKCPNHLTPRETFPRQASPRSRLAKSVVPDFPALEPKVQSLRCQQARKVHRG